MVHSWLGRWRGGPSGASRNARDEARLQWALGCGKAPMESVNEYRTKLKSAQRECRTGEPEGSRDLGALSVSEGERPPGQRSPCPSLREAYGRARGSRHTV